MCRTVPLERGCQGNSQARAGADDRGDGRTQNGGGCEGPWAPLCRDPGAAGPGPGKGPRALLVQVMQEARVAGGASKVHRPEAKGTELP